MERCAHVPYILSAFIRLILQTGLESRQGRAGPENKVQRGCISCSSSHRQKEKRKVFGEQGCTLCHHAVNILSSLCVRTGLSLWVSGPGWIWREGPQRHWYLSGIRTWECRGPVAKTLGQRTSACSVLDSVLSEWER